LPPTVIGRQKKEGREFESNLVDGERYIKEQARATLLLCCKGEGGEEKGENWNKKNGKLIKLDVLGRHVMG